MGKLLTLIFLSLSLNGYSQYTPKKHKKDPKELNTKLLTLVGGTIVIPHLRRAYEYWDALQDQK